VASGHASLDPIYATGGLTLLAMLAFRQFAFAGRARRRPKVAPALTVWGTPGSVSEFLQEEFLQLAVDSK